VTAGSKPQGTVNSLAPVGVISVGRDREPQTRRPRGNQSCKSLAYAEPLGEQRAEIGPCLNFVIYLLRQPRRDFVQRSEVVDIHLTVRLEGFILSEINA
jgi:hypothetical protein